MPMSFGDELVNPSGELELQLDYRRLDQPRAQYIFKLKDSPQIFSRLMELLTNPQSESVLAQFSAAECQLLWELGILVRPEEVPQSVSYSCPLALTWPELLPRHFAQLNLPLRDLIPNPLMWWQTGVEPPPEILALNFRQDFALDTPVLWVRDPIFLGIWPYWPTGEVLEWMRWLLSEKGSVAELPSPLRELLILAQIVVHPDLNYYLGLQRQRIIQAQQFLKTYGYVIVEGLINPLQVAALRSYCRELEIQGYLSFQENERVQRKKAVNNSVACYLQAQSSTFLNQIVAPLYRPLIPTFTYLSYYEKTGLAQHTDRPECEWNISLPLDIFPNQAPVEDWPLWLEIEQGRVAVSLGLGDAVLYAGIRQPHGRPPLPPRQKATVCLFHYGYAEDV